MINNKHQTHGWKHLVPPHLPSNSQATTKNQNHLPIALPTKCYNSVQLSGDEAQYYVHHAIQREDHTLSGGMEVQCSTIV